MSCPRVLVVEDDDALREALRDTLELAGIDVAIASDGKTALQNIAECPPGMVVTDVQMPGMSGETLLRRIMSRHPGLPVVVMTAYGTVQKAVDAMREGAIDYLMKPFEAAKLVELVHRYSRIPDGGRVAVVAESQRSRETLDLARRVAATEATVMITGESGTGKEVLARFIHEHSERRHGPFVAINCAAIPENMLEAVLFGYEKGAFTGAYQARAGKFEQAQGGTLLLDEISEMDLGLQAKLLRVLQEREVERLGGREPVALDVRVLATSNRRMRDEVAAGRFREDLFYRLNVFPLHLAPLRERQEDILPLVRRFVSRHAPAGQPLPALAPEAERALLAYHWPGNVRELENLVQRAMILMDGDEIRVRDLCFEPQEGAAPSGLPTTTATDAGLGGDLRQREQQLILNALVEGNGSRKLAAEKLGISPRTLRYKLARMREAGIAIPG